MDVKLTASEIKQQNGYPIYFYHTHNQNFLLKKRLIK